MDDKVKVSGRAANAKNDSKKGKSLPMKQAMKKIGARGAESYANLYGPKTVSSHKMKLNPKTGRYSVDTAKLPPEGLFSQEKRKYLKEARAENKMLDAARESARKVTEDPQVKAKRAAAKAKIPLAKKGK